MKVIVVGSGKVGSQIIEKLVQEGHEVTAVDIKEAIITAQITIDSKRFFMKVLISF